MTCNICRHKHEWVQWLEEKMKVYNCKLLKLNMKCHIIWSQTVPKGDCKTQEHWLKKEKNKLE